MPSSRPRTGSEHAKGSKRRLTTSHSITEGGRSDTDLSGHRQQQTAAEVKEVEDGSRKPEQAEPAEKRTYKGAAENIGSDT